MNNRRCERVSKRNRCPICHKPDWCLVAPDGSVAICKRVVDGSIKRCGEAGWLHRLASGDSLPRPRSRRIVLDSIGKDFQGLAERYENDLSETRLSVLVDSLGVTAASLQRFGVGWDGDAFTFPMSDGRGRIIGVQRRFLNGKKVCVTGSRLGLFMPRGLAEDGLLLVTEGASDAAAALDLGFEAVGRPSCKTGGRLLPQFAKGGEIVIVGDGDDAGRKGAEELARRLVLPCPSVRVIYPPDGIKDLRSWKAAGLTREELCGRIEVVKPITLTMRTEAAGQRRDRE